MGLMAIPKEIDPRLRLEISRDIGRPIEKGLAYVRDEMTGRWREARPEDYLKPVCTIQPNA